MPHVCQSVECETKLLAGYGAALGGSQPPQYAVGYAGGPPPPTQSAYPGRPAEVEGSGRSKAQLIVGIDFVSNVTCFRYFES